MKKDKLIKIVIGLFILVVSFILYNVIGNNSAQHIIIDVEAGHDVVVHTEEIDESATYYNYTVDGVIIQLFAVKATDGTVRIVFNTCGACNPSEQAYFIQNGDYFECQNCKNKFHRDEIGLKKSFGCSPIAILDDEKQIDGDTITIKSEFIETYKSKFEKINRYGSKG